MERKKFMIGGGLSLLSLLLSFFSAIIFFLSKSCVNSDSECAVIKLLSCQSFCVFMPISTGLDFLAIFLGIAGCLWGILSLKKSETEVQTKMTILYYKAIAVCGLSGALIGLLMMLVKMIVIYGGMKG